VKQYGADAAFDYHNGTSAADQALELSGGVHSGLDCIATTETVTVSLRCFDKGPGQLNVLGQVLKGSVDLPVDIKLGFITTKTLFGRVSLA
jgi:NADPH:quinone reductase-like Zn-dependent oxidoreductase